MTIAIRGGRFPVLVTTPGAPSDITNDTKYNAWPVGCRLPDLRILIAYSKPDNHLQDNNGKAVMKLSSDDGATFGSETTIYDHPTLFTSVMGVSVTRTGRLIASLWFVDADTPGSNGQAAIVYSDDLGTTWSAPISLMPYTTFDAAYTTAAPVVCANGDLLLPIEGKTAPTVLANRSCHTLRSSDDGLTWGGERTVAAYGAAGPGPFYESKPIVLRDGTIRFLHRTTGTADGNIYVNTSTDDGYTWDTPASAFAGLGAPAVCRLRNDALIAVTRKNTDWTTIAYISTTGGLTWGAGIDVDTTMDSMEYAVPFEKLDGRVLIVEGFQPTAAITNSDIKSVILS